MRAAAAVIPGGLYNVSCDACSLATLPLENSRLSYRNSGVIRDVGYAGELPGPTPRI